MIPKLICGPYLETSDQEEVGAEDSLTFSQFLLGTIKIEFNIQIFNKWSDRIAIGVGLLLNYLKLIKENDI